MVRIQLETGYLDVKDGTDFPLNFSVGDIRDIQKRTGSFSKTITLTGSKNNNKLLNNYYDVNIEAGTFDVNKLTKCAVLQNGIPVMESAFIQLLSIEKSQNTDSVDDFVEYKVLIKDSVSDFYTKLGNKELTDLNLAEFNHTKSATNVKNSFTNDVTDGYKYLLPLDDDNFYTLAGFHPAIYSKVYFDKILEAVGYTYEFGSITPTSGTSGDGNNFEKLIIPWNGKTPQRSNLNDLIVKAGAINKSYDFPFLLGIQNAEQIQGWTEELDENNLFDPVTGSYDVPQYVSAPDNITYEIEVDYELRIKNNEAGTIYAWNNTGTSAELLGGFRIFKNGNVVQTWFDEFVSTEVSTGDSFGTGSTLLESGTNTVNIAVTELLPTDDLTLHATSRLSNSIRLYTDTTYTTFADAEVTVKINSVDIRIIASAGYTFGSDVDMNDYIPKKVKQSDFIKSLFQMYNIFPEVDANQPNKLILKHRDDFYDEGSEKDWTNKLFKKKGQTLQFIPELSNKKTVFTYKEDKDLPNTQYLDALKEVYGQLEYTYKNEYTRGVDKKSLIFSPTPITETSFGAIVPMLGYEPETNIRILIDGGTQTVLQDFSIYDYFTSSTAVGEEFLTVAPLLTHFDDPINPTFDINFGVCDYYYYSAFNSKTNNNLFNLYWRRTTHQIDNGKLLTAYFDLNEADIQGLKLNDKIRIEDSWWNINKVIDYNANKNQPTKVELISVDDNLEFARFAQGTTVVDDDTKPVKPVKPVRPTKPFGGRPIKEIIKRNNEIKNVTLNNQDVTICGLNNKISPDVKCGMVVGDGLEVEQSGVYVPVVSGTVLIENPDGTFIDETGANGSPYNLIDAEEDSVLDPFSLSVANFVDAGTDEVLPLGSVVSVNTVDAGVDSVL